MKTFIPGETPMPKVHDLLLSTIAPRPIAFVSTIDLEGNVNLSPFSFFNVFGSNPPICIFSPARSGRTGKTKNTFDYIKETNECVVNIVNEDMLHQMNLASGEYPKGINEFEKSGFTQLESERVKAPRVAESFAQFECKVLQVIETGIQGGSGNLIICEIVLIHISNEVIDENNNIDPLKMRYIARLGKDFYCRVDRGNLFEVPKPKASDQLGIGFDNLPDAIRKSTVLSGSDLAQLASVVSIPNSENSEAEFTTVIAKHEVAKDLISKGAIIDAWHILINKD